MSDNIIQLNEDLIKNDLEDLVRNRVEETLNSLLDKEADDLVSVQKYKRSPERQGVRGIVLVIINETSKLLQAKWNSRCRNLKAFHLKLRLLNVIDVENPLWKKL